MVGLVALALGACASSSGTSDKSVPNPARVNVSSLPPDALARARGESALTYAILDAVNRDRRSEGLSELRIDPNLQKAAATHSADMALRGFVGSFNPDAQGPKERIQVVLPGPVPPHGELIAVVSPGASDTAETVADQVVNVWRINPDHRKTLHASGFDSTGIGTFEADGLVYVTETFATLGTPAAGY